MKRREGIWLWMLFLYNTRIEGTYSGEGRIVYNHFITTNEPTQICETKDDTSKKFRVQENLLKVQSNVETFTKKFEEIHKEKSTTYETLLETSKQQNNALFQVISKATYKAVEDNCHPGKLMELTTTNYNNIKPTLEDIKKTGMEIEEIWQPKLNTVLSGNIPDKIDDIAVTNLVTEDNKCVTFNLNEKKFQDRECTTSAFGFCINEIQPFTILTNKIKLTSISEANKELKRESTLLLNAINNLEDDDQSELTSQPLLKDNELLQFSKLPDDQIMSSIDTVLTFINYKVKFTKTLRSIIENQKWSLNNIKDLLNICEDSTTANKEENSLYKFKKNNQDLIIEIQSFKKCRNYTTNTTLKINTPPNKFSTNKRTANINNTCKEIPTKCDTQQCITSELPAGCCLTGDTVTDFCLEQQDTIISFRGQLSKDKSTIISSTEDIQILYQGTTYTKPALIIKTYNNDSDSPIIITTTPNGDKEEYSGSLFFILGNGTISTTPEKETNSNLVQDLSTYLILAASACTIISLIISIALLIRNTKPKPTIETTNPPEPTTNHELKSILKDTRRNRMSSSISSSSSE